MGFFEKLTSNVGQIWNSSKALAPLGNSEVGIAQLNFNGGRDPSEKEAIYPNWFFSAHLGQPHRKDVRKLRRLAASGWSQMIINTFKKQITTIDWDIVSEDEDDKTDRKEDIKKIKDFLTEINDSEQDVNDINSELITDIAIIDAGITNYVYSSDSYTVGQVPVYDAWGRVQSTEEGLILKPLGQRQLVKMKTADGGTMLKQVDIHKNLLNYWQYSFKHPRQNPTRFEKEEISYLIMNSLPYDIYGFSPIEAIQQVLELLIQGTRYNKDLYTNNAIPDVLISLPKLSNPDLKKLKRRWNNSYKGKPHQVGFINWVIDKFLVLQKSNRDLEWLDGQKWYFKIPFGVFGVSPVEAGYFENSNQSNDDGQERVTVRNAMKPYMRILERMHTRKTITEILQRKDHGLKFKFFPKDHVAEKIEFEQNVKELELGVITINEYRKKKGQESVEWGDEPLRRPFNPETDFTNFGGDPNNPQQGNPQQGNPKQNPNNPKPKKSLIIGDDIVKEANNYADFLNKTFNKFEKSVLSAVEKIDKSYTKKNFGDFLGDLFNKVNTVAFASQVKRYLKQDLLTGMLEAEKETNMDIGFTDTYQSELNKLQGQQVDGYMINGKKWPGIKGVTKEIQADIIRVVQQAISENKSTDEIKALVKQTFKGFSDWRSEMIARTETNRVVNEGKMIGYKETGISGKKIWKTAPFEEGRSSDICQRLKNQTRELDESFNDEKTLKEYSSPPAHPNCRSTIAFVPD